MNVKSLKIAGVVIFAVGAAVTAYGWYTATGEGYYYPKLSFIMPFVAVAGIITGLFANDMVAAHDASEDGKVGLKALPMKVKIGYVVGALVGGLNLALISGTIG